MQGAEGSVMSYGEYGATTKYLKLDIECENSFSHTETQKLFKLYTLILYAFNLNEWPMEGGCYSLN